MKAIIKEKGKIGVTLVDYPYPNLKPGHVIVKVRACGICGSDLHIYRNRSSTVTEGIIGHEGAGEIVEVGEGVESFIVGDRVTYNPFTPTTNQFCGKCQFCLKGHPLGCPERVLMSNGGCMAEYQQINAKALFLLPEGIPYEIGALLEPFNVSYYAILELAKLEPSQTLMILGPGTIGLCALIAAQLVTPQQIIMSGTSKDESVRFQVAQKLGVDTLINADTEDPVQRVLELTEGLGVDVVIEAIGIPLLMQGLKMLRFQGKYIAIGHPPDDLMVQLNGELYNNLIRKRKKILGSWIYDTSTWLKTITLIKKGLVNLEPLITHKLPLTEALKGFKLGLEQQCAKVILQP